MSSAPHRVQVVDSHTAGEPTRVIIDGGPDLGTGNLQSQLQIFRNHHAGFRTGIIQEPRGSEVIVGALLGEPSDAEHAAAVIFFNDVGILGMCGHGTIGLVTTLAHLGRIGVGKHSIETPVGIVHTQLHHDGSVSVTNVPSYCYRQSVTVAVSNHGNITGDIAWGGNWFFITAADSPALQPAALHLPALHFEDRIELVTLTTAIRSALASSGITGANNAPIDHIELTAPPHSSQNSGRNFVLCPGASFDRSPCGTGTSAKLACLHARGHLSPGDTWRQEGILGTVFTGSFVSHGDSIIPTITGRAWVTAESTLLFDPSDPFREGITF